MKDCPDYRDPDAIHEYVLDYFDSLGTLDEIEMTSLSLSLKTLDDEEIYELAAAIQTYCRSHCAECGEHCPDDDRVAAGMKCGPCAY